MVPDYSAILISIAFENSKSMPGMSAQADFYSQEDSRHHVHASKSKVFERAKSGLDARHDYMPGPEVYEVAKSA